MSNKPTLSPLDLSPEMLYVMINEIGGVVFTDPYLLNIVAIRDLDNPDEWNDTLIYFYFDNKKSTHIKYVTEFTTDPGLKYLKSPMNASGTAIVVEGWYRKLWKLGKHKGKYDALVQNTPIKIYRDYNKDSKLDTDPNSIETGIFGINLHHASQYNSAEEVGAWSAGCLVIRDFDDWLDFMKAVHLCYSHGQRYWSLALFNKNQL